MRKIMMLLFISINLIGSTAWATSGQHLKKLKARYPFGLIGDDYGILNEDDLLFNSCIAAPAPVSTHSTAYPYWQCFRLKDAYFDCEGSYDENDKTTWAVMAIGFHEGNQINEYLSPRGISMADCKGYKKDWHRLTAKQDYVCLSGPLIRKQRTEKGKEHASWIFDKFKTAKGCVPYFKGWCDLKSQTEKDCSLFRKKALRTKARSISLQD